MSKIQKICLKSIIYCIIKIFYHIFVQFQSKYMGMEKLSWLKQQLFLIP